MSELSFLGAASVLAHPQLSPGYPLRAPSCLLYTKKLPIPIPLSCSSNTARDAHTLSPIPSHSHLLLHATHTLSPSHSLLQGSLSDQIYPGPPFYCKQEQRFFVSLSSATLSTLVVVAAAAAAAAPLPTASTTSHPHLLQIAKGGRSCHS